MSTYGISKSSLLSLKAEILRKEQDLAKAKVGNEIKASIIKKNTPLELKNKGVEGRSRNDITEEEQDLLKLSSSKLTQKAALYDKLAQQANLTDDVKRRYLVQFDQKNENEIRNEVEEPDANRASDSDEEKHSSDEYDSPDNSDEEWVEYVDCLGRNRKCLRKDLEYLKSRDADLKIIAEHRKKSYNEQPADEKNQETKEEEGMSKEEQHLKKDKDREQELISGDMKREMLRQQWEKEEAELMNKDDVHYQDVLFSEARQHGVGYYAFSKDEEERAKQQEALKVLRKETEEQQKKAQKLKAMREMQLAARMKAARNRKRARMGLPPEEDEPEEIKEQQPKEKTPEPSPEDERKAEEERRLEEARKRHVRPWDVGKEDVKEFYEMTQEEWNEKQRKLRQAEFAPPTSYSDPKRQSSRKKINPYLDSNSIYQADKREGISNSESEDSETDDFIGPTPPPSNITDSIEAGLRFFREKVESTIDRPFTSTKTVELAPEEDKSLNFTTKKEKNVAYNVQQNNDMESSESSVEDFTSSKRLKKQEFGNDYDLIGPPPPPSISESFEVGLQFLKNKAEKRAKECTAPW